MLYCYMAHDRCNFYFSFWAIFCPPPPPQKKKQKSKLKKNEKKNTRRYHHFTHMYQNYGQMMYGS